MIKAPSVICHCEGIGPRQSHKEAHGFSAKGIPTSG